MKGIKNLNVYQKATALLVAGTMAFTLAGCAGSVDMSSLSASEVLSISDVRDVTLIDELIEAGRLQYNEDLNIIEAADQLERYLDIVETIDGKVDFTGVDQLEALPQARYELSLNYSLDEVNALIEASKYNGKDVVQLEQKLNALKQLRFIYDYCSAWIYENGTNVSIEFMMATIKGSIADDLEMSVNDYNTIVIPPARATNEPESNFIRVGDESYEVRLNTEELWNTISYIYAMQEFDRDCDNAYETYRKALNFGKTTMAAGANINNKSRVTEQYDASYIKENYVK